MGSHFILKKEESSKDSMAVSLCSINDDLNKDIRSFRFNRSTKARAMILKIDQNTKEPKADGELMEDVTLDDLKDELPEHQPRFVLYTFPYTHADERISYPLCLIFSSPRESKTELMVMYAGSKLELEKRAEVHKVYEVCDLDDLSLDLIKEKLAKREKREKNSSNHKGFSCGEPKYKLPSTKLDLILRQICFLRLRLLCGAEVFGLWN